MKANPPARDGDDMNEKHEHKWIVFSTALATHELMVRCECGDFGVVPNPTKEEWSTAFHAPSNNYEWDEPDRVEIKEGYTTCIHPEYKIWTITRG